MARQLRIEYPGAIYHVTVRGNAQQDIFQDARDRSLLCKRFAESVEIYAVRLYLFCLMNNHFHLVLETPGANLSRFMQSVLTGYTVVYNLRHNRCGHLTQGRFGARLVEGNEYLLKLSRYVHLNPTKVKDYEHCTLPELIGLLRAYRWSSYRGYIGQEKRLDWIDYEPMLALMGGREKDRPMRYRTFVESGIETKDDELMRAMAQSARSIGGDDFRDWVDSQHADLLKKRKRQEDVSLRHKIEGRPDPASILAAVASVAGTTSERLKTRCRNKIWKGIAARLLLKYAGVTRRECACWIGVRHGSSVSYQIKQAQVALETDARLSKKVARLESQLETSQ